MACREEWDGLPGGVGWSIKTKDGLFSWILQKYAANRFTKQVLYIRINLSVFWHKNGQKTIKGEFWCE